ncbi:reverse transcriptase domain-containing protein [Tanacetum coccineum]|uniref:Reverse transcriptase domain-containing protein n=1 Tax=Tanacetum coccineum TaxID=301880 RepID=A0ABQ5EU60_9ASTR
MKTSLEEPPTDLELKPLLDNLEYAFLEEPYFLPVIISSQLSKENKNKLVSLLKRYKQTFAWKTTDIPGIRPSFYKHKIQLLDDKKLVVQKQRRLNPNMQEVIKKEIVKLLDTGIIYPIADSPWVSPIHCVPKKGGITVVTNKKYELVPTRTVIGWRVCIDYHKLNEATAKDHFPLPFMDQMLERLARNKYFYFLDVFSGYFQIPIDPMDQEKTTFTCPFGAYAYRRMPFGLCNAPDTFQRCMLAIFHDMTEESVKVFMDNFSVFGNSFDHCLNNLDKMLQQFDIEIKDKKGAKNVAADHLSWIENDETSDDSDVDDNFPRETLMEITTKDTPWFSLSIMHSKWAEAQALPTNDARVVISFLKKLFCHFGVPKALISDRGTHFCNKIMEKTMKDMELTTALHPITLKRADKLIIKTELLKESLKKL